MLFTTKTEYGMRAMVALARNEVAKSKKDIEPLSTAQIAKNEHISRSYLERLLAHLKSDDLIKSVKGPAGGYVLARQAKKINIFEIVESLEGTLAVFDCISHDTKKVTCTPGKCLSKQVWMEVQKSIIHTLRKFTLADLI